MTRRDNLLTGLKLRHPPTDSATTLHFGRFDDQPHQHLPSARISASPWRGLLIADEVGLGKTISALHHLRQMHARGKSGLVIIACPASLKAKWEWEAKHRVDLECTLINSGRELLNKLDGIEEGASEILLVSHGLLRQATTLSELVERLPELMMTIIDEAHHLRNPNTRLHDAATILSMRSKQMLLLTATPVNISDSDLWVQLSLLAPDRWPTATSFRKTLRPVRQLNDMLNAVSKPIPELVWLKRGVDTLSHTIGFALDPRLLELSEIIETGDWENEVEELRRQSANLIRELRPLNEVLVRTRRRDLDWNLPERVAHTIDVGLNQDEMLLYSEAKEWSKTLARLRQGDRYFSEWAMLIPERMASSCLRAFADHVLSQMKDAARIALDFDREDPDEEERVVLDDGERRILARLGNLDGLLEAARNLGNEDSKFEAMLLWLEEALENEPNGAIMIFSNFIGTLNHLRRNLVDRGVTVGLVNGQTPMRQRDIIRERFRNGEFSVLLSSEVGSEGLDQQHCHRLINYDLPWNPMRIEQRIGRIDRYGQTSPTVDVVNLAVEGTIDAAILFRLYNRIRLFEDTLGMVDPLLGKAMRMVANEEMFGPQEAGERGRTLIQVEGGGEGENEDVESLLAQRERWLNERSEEEREWLGPDPGITEVRGASEALDLDLQPERLLEWVKVELPRIRAGSRLVEVEDGGLLLSLTDEVVEELLTRAEDKTLSDGLQIGWLESLQQAKARGGPHWWSCAIHRDVSSDDPTLTYLTPWHPLIRWLSEQVEEEFEQVFWTNMERPAEWPDEGKMLVCLDWTVVGLKRQRVRRWLLLDEKLSPLIVQPQEPWKMLPDNFDRFQPDRPVSEELERGLDQIHDQLLDSERKRLIPRIEELRVNAREAWGLRIQREVAQLEYARWKANQEGVEPDPRWMNMKNGLIRRLERELADRLVELEGIEVGMFGELEARMVVNLECT